MKGFVGVRGRETKKARVEIIPMIDAIFFLLVFFMYSSLSMVKMKGMGVSVPHVNRAPTTPNTKPPRRYIVTMDQNGATFVNLTPVALDQLTATLTTDLSTDPEGTIVVNVFKKRTVQDLVNLMDQVNQVKTAKGEPAGVIIATSPITAKDQAAAQHGG
jgi:biopolymer transport protein ExbD